MPFTKIEIDPTVRAAYPDACVGWLMADVDVRGPHPHAEELKASIPAALAARGIDGGNLAALAAIPDIARWRDVFSAMGAKPSKYRSSLEALVRRAAKGEMWSVSGVVDCYNCLSAMTLLPMGAHDTAKIDGAIVLRYGRAGEKFLPLGAAGEEIAVDPRHIVYADESKVCCWLWNHRDTRLAAVTEETREAVFVVDAAFTPVTTSVRAGLDLLADHLAKTGCTVKGSGVI